MKEKWWERLTPKERADWRIFERHDEFGIGQKVSYLGNTVTVTGKQQSRPPLLCSGYGYGGLEVSWMEPAEHGLMCKKTEYLSPLEVDRLIEKVKA